MTCRSRYFIHLRHFVMELRSERIYWSLAVRMKNVPRRPKRSSLGLTLLELTVVISVLLSLASLLTTGVRAWKRGADRSQCLISLRTFQVAMRAYQNLYGYIPNSQHFTEAGTTDIVEHLRRKEYITSNQYTRAIGTEPCQGGGFYSRGDPGLFPPLGQPYLACSLAPAPDEHLPTQTADW
jgi:type II secretory pathway pseudopilin PulG